MPCGIKSEKKIENKSACDLVNSLFLCLFSGTAANVCNNVDKVFL